MMWNNGLKITFFLFTLAYLPNTDSARILGVWPLPGKTHFYLGNSLMLGLAEAGHDVTMVSPFKNSEAPKNGTYTDIYLDGIFEAYQEMTRKYNITKETISNHIIRSIQGIVGIGYFTEKELSHPKFLELLNSNQTFDVVIFEYFGNDALTLVLSKFNAPIIVFQSTPTSSWINDMVGNPAPLSYIPQIRAFSSQKMSFIDKLYNTYIYVVDEVAKFVFALPNQEKIARKFHRNAPSISEAYTNVSLALVNSHESYCQAVPMVPNIVQIGGFHVRPPKKLPADIKTFLDGANKEHGAIYFNMGTNFNIKDMPKRQRDAILRVFGRLKQRVLMKWEDDVLPGKPANVMIGKWLPQNDILGHPNVKLFISHGGMLGTTEAIYHGVPVLAIPTFGDQFYNAKVAENLGYALSLTYEDANFTEDKLFSLIKELLFDPKYKSNAERRSKLFHDRPMSPLQTAIYWIEYVIKYNGAPHLRVLGKDFAWYEYFILDVIGFIVMVVLLFIIGSVLFVKVLIRKLLFRRNRYKDKIL